MEARQLRVSVMLPAAMGIAFGAVFSVAVAKYWALLELGSSAANGFAIYYLVFPVSVILGASAAWLFARLSLSRQLSGRTTLLVTALGLLLLFVVLLGLEVLRTAHLQTEGGATAGQRLQEVLRRR